MADMTQQPTNPYQTQVDPGQSPTMLALKNLAKALPAANSAVATGQQSARDMQLQQAVAGAPQGTNTAAAQQLGQQQGQEAGQQMIQRAEQGVGEAGAIGQTGLQAQAVQNQGQIIGQQQGATQQQTDNVQRLASLSEGVKQQLYDAQMQFQKDQNGRTIFTANQLADYTAMTAQNKQVFEAQAQQANQLNQMSLEATQTAYQKVAEDLTQKYQIAKQAGDEKQAEAIAQQKHAADIAMQQAQANAANNSAAWAAGGMIVGGVAGAVVGGPAGAAVGASAGGALGTLAGNTVAKPGAATPPAQ